MLTPTIIRLQHLVDKTSILLKQWKEEEMSFRSAPHKWSKKEIIGHLIDSAANNHRRFILAQIEPQPYKLIRYAQNEWVRLNEYQQSSTSELIQFRILYNQQIICVVSQIPAPVSQYICISDDQEPVTLQWLIEDYVAHLEHHLSQVLPEYTF
jgi:phenylpropionate dioxygenase-like ring-hydroxylating dioxygenase large terminal subunit